MSFQWGSTISFILQGYGEKNRVNKKKFVVLESFAKLMENACVGATF